MIIFKETTFHLCVCVGVGESASRPVIRMNQD